MFTKLSARYPIAEIILLISSFSNDTSMISSKTKIAIGCVSAIARKKKAEKKIFQGVLKRHVVEIKISKISDALKGTKF